MGSFQSNAIGQVELSCLPTGLAIGLFGLGSYAEGYATGALSHGTRFTIPYTAITTASSQGDQVYLEFEAPGFPHDRLVLRKFSAGPGVPLHELRRRRLILQFSALSVAALSCLAASLLVPSQASAHLAWGALGYGIVAGALVLALGFALDQTLFVRPPGEEPTRQAFVRELSHYFPNLIVTDSEPVRKKRLQLDPSKLLPRSAWGVGLLLAATILTALVSGQRILFAPPTRIAEAPRIPIQEETEPVRVPTSAPTPTPPDDGFALAPAPTTPKTPEPDDTSAAQVERRCACDRADSQLWKEPIPRLSTLLIERRSLQLKNYVRTQLEVAVINNGDSPISEITLHVQFYEQRGKEQRPTKERPLYFEGPLRPGQAIKWSTEARGTDFSIATPDLGTLGPNGEGSASADHFAELLDANHRPVRLHGARLLSYLGDPRAREAALHLKDAMRAAEAPYLRRVLMATGDIRVCDIDLQKRDQATVGVCVYNASDQDQEELGIQLNLLRGSLDTAHPLADPPELSTQEKWKVPRKLGPHAGVYVRVPLQPSLAVEDGQSLEVVADLYDLLD